jgi:acetylglutamate kinase
MGFETTKNKSTKNDVNTDSTRHADISMDENADILLGAIRYLKEFRGKTFVVKFSGNVLNSSEIMWTLIKDIALIHSVGINIVVVHGSGNKINEMMDTSGLKPEFVNGLRVTDEKTLGIVIGALHDTNDQIVGLLNDAGEVAVGISGISGNLLKAKIIDPSLKLVGKIERINTELLDLFISNRYIPVIFPIGFDDEGRKLNINADTVAGKIASVLNAEKLIMVTSVKGILREYPDEKSIIKKLTLEDADNLLHEDFIKTGMTPKLKACIMAVRNGVHRTHIIGTGDHSILRELLTEEGTGTMIYKTQ